MAQWFERWILRSKGRGFEFRQEYKKNFEFFRVEDVVLTRCRCAQPPRVYTHSYERLCTHVEHPVVHVRVRWIMET